MFVDPVSLKATVDSLRSGARDITTYVHQACDRLEKIDADIEAMLPEPGRRARLAREAEALQKRFPDPEKRPPLHGALVAVKDIFHASGFVTRAGSAVPPELIAGEEEAACVTLLRAAGALVLGKSVTTEFAYFAPGPTRNPHNRNHTPGGSSSGSAAAVAAGFAPLALGTQTVGSVIRPAAFCGVVGFKPTLHRVPSAGLVHFSRSADHVGFFTADVESMRAAAGVLCQAWRVVPEPASVASLSESDAAAAKPGKLSLPVIGVPDGPYLEQTEPAALASFERSVDRLMKSGYVIKRIPIFRKIDTIRELHLNLVYAEFAREHRQIYAGHRDLLRPRTVEMMEMGLKVTDDELHTARRHCGALRSELEQVMASEGLDLWICPAATGPAPEGIHATGNPNMNLPWTHTGMPVVTVPADKSADGLPLGLQLVARFGADEYLLAWAQMTADRLGRPE